MAQSAKLVSIDKTESNTIDSTEPRKFTFLVGVPDQNNASLKIMATCDDVTDGGSVTFSLPLKRFNEKTKKYVADEELMNKTQATLNEFLGVTVEDVEANTCAGKTFEAYTDGERGFFEPRAPYIRFDKLDTASAKLLKKTSGPYKAVMITDSPNYHRFNFGIEVALGNSDVPKRFRVSQIVIESDDVDEPDRKLSLKYETKDIRSFSALLDNDDSHLDPAVAKKLRTNIEGLAQRARADKVEEIKDELGIDLDEIVKSGDQTVEFESVEVQSLDGGGGEPVYFLVGTLSASDDE